MKLDQILKSSYQRYIVADFLATTFFNKRIALVVDGIEAKDVEKVKTKLLDAYGDVAVTVEVDGKDVQTTVNDLPSDFDTLTIEPMSLTESKRFDFSDLEQIMHRLRADDGCEWDRAQTHESIRINLIEEAYELVEAIDMKNAEMMKEECGDILMQAVFHAEIAQKNGEFDYTDMISGLCRKLIDRHTHIFGANHADNADEALVFGKRQRRKKSTIRLLPTK